MQHLLSINIIKRRPNTYVLKILMVVCLRKHSLKQIIRKSCRNEPKSATILEIAGPCVAVSLAEGPEVAVGVLATGLGAGKRARLRVVVAQHNVVA